MFLLSFLSRSAGISSVAVRLRALTEKSALETAACQELEIWYNSSFSQKSVRSSLKHFVILYDLVCALILGLTVYFKRYQQYLVGAC